MIRLALPYVDAAGEPTQLELRIVDDRAELWSHEYQCAVFDREALREWLTHPIGEFTVDDVAWIATSDGVVLRIRLLFLSWQLSGREQNRLRAYL